MIGRCERCDGLTRVGGRGQPQRYCSNACKQAAYRDRALPAELRNRRQWVRASGKVPVTVAGFMASSTRPDTWSTYAEAMRSTAGDGLGIMLGDGLGCYDLDHVTDDEARIFLAEIPERAIFVERSMSGRGVHVFIEAPESPGWKRTIGGLSVERYTRWRFIRMTGVRLSL